MLRRSSVVPRGTWTESIGIPREVRAAPPGRTDLCALMPPSEHGGKHLEHDPEKLQTFRGIAVGAFPVRLRRPVTAPEQAGPGGPVPANRGQAGAAASGRRSGPIVAKSRLQMRVNCFAASRRGRRAELQEPFV